MAKTYITKQVITLNNVRVGKSVRKVRFNATTKRVRVTTKGERAIIVTRDPSGEFAAQIRTEAKSSRVSWYARTPAKAFAKAVKNCWA